MQLYTGSAFVEALASYLHVVWQAWLSAILAQGNVPPETRIFLPSSVVNRWKKLASVSYASLTSPEKAPYRHLAEELEDTLAKEFIILPKADYEEKIRAEVVVSLGKVYPELLDVLVFARGEALGKNQEIVQKSTRSLAFLSQITQKSSKSSNQAAKQKVT